MIFSLNVCFDTTFFQIISSTMTACKLSHVLADKLETCFQTFPHLEHLNIDKPTAVEQFPHCTTIKQIKLRSIPPNCRDWEWLTTLQSLEDIYVSVKGSTRDSGRLHVHDENAEWIDVIEDEALTNLMKIFYNLPQNLKIQV